MKNPLRKQFNYCFCSATLILTGINILFYIITTLFPDTELIFGCNPALFIFRHMYWQPVSYMFIHGNLSHLISNMLGLVFFGYVLERAIGSKEFLLMYFVCGILSGLISLLYYTLTGNYRAILIGASGAVFSVMFAYAVIFPRAKIYIWGILPLPSPLLVVLYAAVELFCQMYGVNSNVAHFTHLFGFGTAFLYFIIRLGINPFRVWKNAYFPEQ